MPASGVSCGRANAADVAADEAESPSPCGVFGGSCPPASLSTSISLSSGVGCIIAIAICWAIESRGSGGLKLGVNCGTKGTGGNSVKIRGGGVGGGASTASIGLASREGNKFNESRPVSGPSIGRVAGCEVDLVRDSSGE